MKESGPIFIYSMKTDDLFSNLIFGIDDDDETMKLESCIIINDHNLDRHNNPSESYIFKYICFWKIVS